MLRAEPIYEENKGTRPQICMHLRPRPQVIHKKISSFGSQNTHHQMLWSSFPSCKSPNNNTFLSIKIFFFLIGKRKYAYMKKSHQSGDSREYKITTWPHCTQHNKEITEQTQKETQKKNSLQNRAAPETLPTTTWQEKLSSNTTSPRIQPIYELNKSSWAIL